MSIEIQVNYETIYKPTFKIKPFVIKAIKLLGLKTGFFEFTFVNSKTMTDIHETYLNDATDTDIVTFNLKSIDDPVGDIYICVDEARKNALSLKTSLDDEIKQLLLHGILHCIGYEDDTHEKKKKMLNEQNRIIKLI